MPQEIWVFTKQQTEFNDTEILILLYIYVRSKLEYASVVWNPGYDKHKNTIKYVQRRFVKFLRLKNDGIYPKHGFSHKCINTNNDFIGTKKRKENVFR